MRFFHCPARTGAKSGANAKTPTVSGCQFGKGARLRITAAICFAFGICTIVLLPGCSEQHATIPLPAQATSLSSLPLTGNGYQVLYKFKGDNYSQTDGFEPFGSLIAVKDRLYGTTAQGGLLNYSACGAGKFFAGCGTVFEVGTTGMEHVLYRFAGGSDGYFPQAGLLALNGTLYGTTNAGGGGPCQISHYSNYACGTVFSLSLFGQERVLHSFTGAPDGAGPTASLIAVNGALYGTTPSGGYTRGGCGRNHGCGVVFRVSTSGSERVVYAFRGGKFGAFPSGSLLWVNGTLYGETSAGGHGCGMVFKVSVSGSESVVYSFNGAHDGCRPFGGLVAIKGALYGVTAYGGGRLCGCGTVFKLSMTGNEQVIHRFKVGGDGQVPFEGLIALKGVLYGTTAEGGTGCSASRGCGTIFKVTTSGIEQILYSFKGGTDGVYPRAGLLALRGTLYGTTTEGGGYSCGLSSSLSCGTVFKILP
jgi:uncharacterized repeat protein (TIGR03803 family)